METVGGYRVGWPEVPAILRLKAPEYFDQCAALDTSFEQLSCLMDFALDESLESCQP